MVHFGLHLNNETTQKKKYIYIYTQTKHPRVWMLYDDSLNDSPRYYC